MPRRPTHPPPAFPTPHKEAVLTSAARDDTPNVSVPPTEQPPRDTRSGTALDTHRPEQASSCQVLLRKEVIQPHLPVRLPCYDFVPIASPTFDHSLPLRGWAMGFGCYRLS